MVINRFNLSICEKKYWDTGIVVKAISLMYDIDFQFLKLMSHQTIMCRLNLKYNIELEIIIFIIIRDKIIFIIVEIFLFFIFELKYQVCLPFEIISIHNHIKSVCFRNFIF